MSAQVRMADALLRSVGGRTVLLHVPAAGVSSDVGEQVGLGVPAFQDVELGLVVFRRVRPRVSTETVTYELLVSASAVKTLVGSLEYRSAELLFASTVCVLVDAVPYYITSATSAEAFGEVYLYRLALRGAAAGLV
jgi:hypothetical protein